MNPLLLRLADADPAVRAAACRAVREDPSAVLLLDALAEALADPAAAVVRAASDTLVDLASAHREVHELLRRALRSEEPRRRFAAALASSRLGPPEPGLLPPVVEALGSREPDVRWAAARLLVDIGRLHPFVLPLALSLARTAPPPARRMALFCLRELAPEEPEVAVLLVDASRDADPEHRRAALTSMAALCGPPSQAIERLVETLEGDADPVARRLAAVALGEIGARTPDSLVRALGVLGVSGVLDRIVAEDPDVHLRHAAQRALARLADSARQNTSESSE